MHRERDYAFGQLMLRLRTGIGLTQAGVAELLGVSRHAVGAWEAGESYPKADRLKLLIAFGIQEQAFPAGHEVEEIRTLWRAAHQKQLLDEQWLREVLREPAATAVAPSLDTASDAPPARPGPRTDWGDALDVASLYGRDAELELLERWVVQDHCRVVSVLGMGGIGKSALTVTLMHRLAPQFDVVIWRSLRDAPPCATLVDGCLQVLAPQVLPNLEDSLAARLQVLMQQLREQRVLLVLDNLETLLEEGTGSGGMRTGFASYTRLLRQVAETAHQSCLVCTSREKPADLVPLEGSRAPVRALQLWGLDIGAAAELLAEKELLSAPREQAHLVELYQGNPLALKIVAQTIVDMFGGDIKPFMQQGELVFGGVQALLDEQVGRLSPIEQRIGAWLAVLREPVVLADLSAVLSPPRSTVEVLEALNGLQRRSFIERGQRAGSFTLQSVVLEYATARLVAAAGQEIEHGQLNRLLEFGLCRAQANEYVRQTQEQQLLVPVLNTLQRTYADVAAVEARLLWLLEQLRNADQTSQGYGPANLVALLRLLRGDLRGLDLSGLALRGVSLQGVAMQDAALCDAVIRDSVFAETFDDILAVTISSTGTFWAASSRRGELRVWDEGGLTLRQVWRGHRDMVWALAFSPDGRVLASGCWDGTVKLWDAASGTLRWSGRHGSHLHLVAFAPDGRLLASSGPDGIVWLWDVDTGTQRQALAHADQVLAVTWSPDGRVLASGDAGGNVRLWEPELSGSLTCVLTRAAHAHNVDGLAFTPDGRTLASASWDGMVKLWEVIGGRLQRTLTGHTGPVRRVAWSPNGSTLASCGFEPTIWLWDVDRGSYRAALQGHSAPLTSLAFTPDSRVLISASEDGTVRVWDVAGGQCLRVLQGYVASLYDVAWSPDGALVAGGGTDRLVTIHTVSGGTVPRTLSGECSVVFGLGWSPDGRWLASSEWLNVIRLWDLSSGTCVDVLQHTDDPDNYFYGLAWSPDGQRIASATSRWGVLVWDITTRRLAWAGSLFPTWIRPVAWSPDGAQLAGGGDDGTLYLWNATSGALVRRLEGHHGMITSVAWSSDGAQLASASAGSGGESELFVWEAHSGKRVRILAGHPEQVTAIAWSSRSDQLISGGSDGALRWWDVASGQCLQIRQAHQGTVHALKRNPDGSQVASCGDDGAIVVWESARGEQVRILRRDRPYERMDITGITGLSDAQRASLITLGAVEQVRDRVLPRAAPPAAAVRLPRRERDVTSALPVQPTSLVGRDDELRRIAEVLADPRCRLLTLLGPGGIGKTRLALEAAAAYTARFADGVAFVPLAAVDRPDQIVSAIGTTLGLSPAGRSDHGDYVIDVLRARSMLLVLDNFEHVLAGTDLVADLLARAPHITLLVTSRERLNIRAEWLFDVAGLSYPTPAHDDSAWWSSDQADTYGAVRLFVERARQVQPALVLDDATMQSIARICRHVEGIPLAIELAAANVRALPPAAIEQQLGVNLDSLVTTIRDVPERHRSLHAAFDQSYKLLAAHERRLFRGLAVFRGGWTVAAAREVMGAPPAMLTALVDKSLVRGSSAASTQEPRFTMLEPIRAYAMEQLAASGEAERLRRRHAEYFVALAEHLVAEWDTPQINAAIARQRRELDNLRAALQWSLDTGNRTLGLKLALALWGFWRSYGYIAEGRAWLATLLSLDARPADAESMTIHHRALHAAAWLASDQHDFAAATSLFAESSRLRQALGETESTTDLLINAARQARTDGVYQQAVALLEHALEHHSAANERSVEQRTPGLSFDERGQLVRELGLVLREQGDFERAQAMMEHGLELARANGDRVSAALALLGLGDIARDRGDGPGVRAYCEPSLATFREFGMHWATGFALNALAVGAYCEDDVSRAQELIEESVQLFQELAADASLAEVLITQGNVLRAQGDVVGAYSVAGEAARLACAGAPRVFVAASLEELASIVVERDHMELTAALLAVAHALRAQMGAPVRPADQRAVESARARAQAALGDGAFDAAWVGAHSRSPEQILSMLPDTTAFALVRR